MKKAPTVGESIAWHAESIEDVLRRVESSPDGLGSSEARRRLEVAGPNELPRARRVPFWWVFLRQFHSPLIYILAAAALFSVVINELTDASFIGVVLLINAIIGSIQEWRAEKANQSLQKLIVTRAAVTRDGETIELPAAELVPGDVVWLESGNRVPADMRLLSAHSLEVDESLLTGESLSVLKDPEWPRVTHATLGDRKNMCFAGSVVARGRGAGLVVETGGRTAVGRLALDLSARGGGKPPLLLRLERFTRLIGVAVLAAAAMVALLGVLLQGKTAGEMFMVAVALAVSAIPEGLPVTLTVVLAIATARMARRGVVVRKLAAVEGLGSCTLVASDKTGTLTCNELTVHVALLPGETEYAVSGAGYSPHGEVRRDDAVVNAGELPALAALTRACMLCNEGSLHRAGEEWHWHGDPTDIALLAFGIKAGCSHEQLELQYPQLNQIPFEAEHKFAATFHRAPGGGSLCCVKGAPERVLDMCSWDAAGGNAARERMADNAAALAARGFRVLAVAEGECLDAAEGGTPPHPLGLRFLGFVGMIDPLREGVKEAVAACGRAGIRVSMVTGDHPVTALAISRELGLAQDRTQVLAGHELEKLPEDELPKRVAVTRVFARTTPQQKLQIVNAARAAGHFVAVTGDGVNDAPALRAANIGVAMGKSGTDVAREAAELVISDDNFATIVAGVEEGRVAFDNLRKVIFLLVSTGAAEVLMVMLAVGSGSPLPLLPVQLLWLNLVTNGIQDKALAFEPREGDVLDRPPRPTTERIFNRIMIERIVVAAGVMGLVGYAAFAWLLHQGWTEPAARNGVLLLFVLFENFHVGNCRSETRSLFVMSPFKNPFLLACVTLAFAVHLVAMYLPAAQKILGTAPLDWQSWLLLLLLSLALPAAMELHKLALRLRRRTLSG